VCGGLFDPRDVLGAERLLAPRIRDLEGMRLGAQVAPEFRHEALMQRDAFGMSSTIRSAP
jgi:hypothetical protein